MLPYLLIHFVVQKKKLDAIIISTVECDYQVRRVFIFRSVWRIWGDLHHLFHWLLNYVHWLKLLRLQIMLSWGRPFHGRPYLIYLVTCNVNVVSFLSSLLALRLLLLVMLTVVARWSRWSTSTLSSVAKAWRSTTLTILIPPAPALGSRWMYQPNSLIWISFSIMSRKFTTRHIIVTIVFWSVSFSSHLKRCWYEDVCKLNIHILINPKKVSIELGVRGIKRCLARVDVFFAIRDFGLWLSLVIGFHFIPSTKV